MLIVVRTVFPLHHAVQAHPPHQARHGAATDRNPVPKKLSPDLPDAVDAEILLVIAVALEISPAAVGIDGSVDIQRGT